MDKERDLIAMIGAVLSYSTTGHNHPCGATVGADGRGDFSIVITGPPDEAEDAARQYLQGLEQQGLHITHAIISKSNEHLIWKKAKQS